MKLTDSIERSISTFRALLGIEAEIEHAAQLVLTALLAGHKLLICGNGGSAAEAQHFSTELVGRYFKHRRSLPAVALSADGSLVTCIGNDYAFDEVFARQVQGLAQPGDVLVAISSSGGSRNIVAALQQARRQGLSSIALLGRGGGAAKGLATVDLVVPGSSGRTAQEAHLFIIHHLCDRVDEQFP